MLKSFRTTLMLVMIGLLIITFLTVVYFSRKETEKAMLFSANEGSQNALRLSLLTIENGYNDLLHFKKMRLDAHKQKLQDLVTIVEAFLNGLYRDAQTGLITEDEAKRQALEKMRAFRYGDNEYFWIANYQSVLISHPDDKLNGADFSQVKDVHGNLIVPPMVKIARENGSGYYSYWWRRLGREEPVEKLSYAKHFSAWNWAFGTGFYIDDIEEEARHWQASMIENLAVSFSRITLAKTGYLFVFDQQKRIIIHPTLKGDEGVNLKNPVTGGMLFDELIAAARDPKTPFEYLWDRPDDPKQYIYPKQSYVAYFEPFGWYIASSVYVDELNEPMRNLGYHIVLIFAIALLIAILAVIVLSRTLTRPINAMSSQVKTLSNFNLNVNFDQGTSFLEIRALAIYLNDMLHSFRDIVGQVQRSGIQVTSSATELSATAKEQEATMANQLLSTNQVVKSVKEISDISAQLVETMHNVTRMIEEATGFANKGQSDLLNMEEAMRHMEDASKSISGRLEAISEKAENITTVVTTINKVAEQTNLLSLNAAIEAEKAGEFGRGFTVVAREIRRLADQTAVATLDIGRMVQEMQSAVASGIMEMDKFIAEVRHSAENVGKISMQLTLIIDQVQALAPNFELVNVAMGQQSQNAQKISASISNLSEEMSQTRDALHETYSAIEQLNDAARGLQQEVSRFKVS